MTGRALQATRPLAFGITALRNVTWAAAILLGASHLRHACHAAAGRLASSVEQCVPPRVCFNCARACVYLCLCVCESERGGEEEREGVEGEHEHAYVCLYHVPPT